jgi:uncharacterized protein YlbG (UPF0298 family)
MSYKKILQFLSLFLIFALGNLTYAAEPTKTPITFIYVNGSNTNTERDKVTFSNGIKKIQVSMKKNMESNDFVEKNLLDNGNLYISEKPKIFFWGYDSNQALSRVKEDLLTLKVLSPKMAQTVRTIIADVMHDAIWVQKEYNMQVIVNDLHKSVMASYNRGEKVILAGHSAGSFVTFRYLFHKSPAIIFDENLIKNKTELAFIKKHPVKPTCVDAITTSGIGVFSTTGDFVVNQNPKLMKEDYLNLNKYTDTECFPNGEVLGIVNFGSPIALFYSDNGGTSLAINQYNIDLYRYLISNNLFFLTVNFNDDPIGFPLSKNLTSEELENIYNIGFNQKGRGFFYSKSDVRSPATFIGAHVSYWKYPDRFSKAVVKAYVDGYKNFYDL